jgi:hypothetical protein
MEHPVARCVGVTKLLNHLIREPAESLFVGFPCLPLITGIFVRPRPPPVTVIPVVILPVVHAPQREAYPRLPTFEEHPDP